MDLLFHSQVPPKSFLWNKIWNPNALPKVNIFYSLLLHKKILTSKNLRKKGIYGPSRCPLCENHEESISHLFLECPYVKAVWCIALGSLYLRICWPSSLQDFISSWDRHYMGSLKTKSSFKSVWLALTKYICWQLWLSRNSLIFKSTPLLNLWL